jgi:CBS domain containing-hemolysin-like protein
MIAVVAETWAWAFWAALCAGNLFLTGLASGLETGVYRTNRVRVELRAEAGGRKARRLRRMLSDMDNTLAVLLIGTNIHSYLMTFAAAVLFTMAGWAEHVEWLTVAVVTPAAFVFKDSLPKNLFQRLPERLTYRFVGLLRGADVLYKVIGLSILVRLFSQGLLRLLGRKRTGHSLFGHDGLAAVVAEGHAVGALTLDQRLMSERVMKIAGVRAVDVMQPMAKVVSAPLVATREQFLARLHEHDYSRLPLLRSDGQVAGVVDVYHVLVDETCDRPAETMTPPLTIPEGCSITQALLTLQRARRSQAVVADAAGRHVGILTVKDLVEEIVGELEAW